MLSLVMDLQLVELSLLIQISPRLHSLVPLRYDRDFHIIAILTEHINSFIKSALVIVYCNMNPNHQSF